VNVKTAVKTVATIAIAVKSHAKAIAVGVETKAKEVELAG
jgi:hypothetical protein